MKLINRLTATAGVGLCLLVGQGFSNQPQQLTNTPKTSESYNASKKGLSYETFEQTLEESKIPYNPEKTKITWNKLNESQRKLVFQAYLNKEKTYKNFSVKQKKD